MTFTVLPLFVIRSDTEVEPRCEVTLVTLIEIFVILLAIIDTLPLLQCIISLIWPYN